MTRDQLDSNREPRGCQTTRDAHTRNPSQIEGDRVNVREIHLKRIVRLLPEPERRGRRNRCRDDVAMRERIAKVLPDQRSHFLSFAVVCIIVAGRQRVGSKHDAALDFGTKPFVSSPAVHLLEGRSLFSAKAISYAVFCLKKKNNTRVRSARSAP